MNIRSFVSGSSVILIGWLGATFLNEVPIQRYPKLDLSNPVRAEQKTHSSGIVLRIQADPSAVVTTSN